MTEPLAQLALVGDLGGTNARFAVAARKGSETVLLETRTLPAADYPTGALAVSAYLTSLSADLRPTRAALAVAGPVVDGRIDFTNLGWSLSEVELGQRCELQSVRLINDFTALGLGVAWLGSGDLQLVGPALPTEADGTIAVVGAGTGFGVTGLARRGALQIPMACEGGHIAFAPTDEIEVLVWRILQRRYGRVSVERILSGPGLLDLHRALCEIRGRPCPIESPVELSRAADAGDGDCGDTLLRFFAIYGAAAGDFALAFGAAGGLYVGGGIAPDRMAWLQRSAFRSRFEDKGRLSSLVRRIPTGVIVGGHPALLGAAELALGGH